MYFRSSILVLLGLLLAAPGPSRAQSLAWPATRVDRTMIAKIREEGLQRSQIANTLSFMTDVLGARLTNSRDMKRAQAWALDEMRRLGLSNAAAEPFMDYGVPWDNEYVSLHLVEPDYQPMVGYPIAWTPGTGGRRTLDVVIADVTTPADLEPLRGTLRGKAVLATAMPTIDRTPFEKGSPRRPQSELDELAREGIPPSVRIDPMRPANRAARNPDLLSAADRMAFFKAEGVAVVLESSSGWPGAVRGFGRPGTREDGWSREGTLAALPTLAVTPEHYNRMYRIRLRDVPVRVEVEVRNRIGDRVEQARNVVAEIPGSDLADEVVMLGAHFDTWHASPNASDNTSGVTVMLETMRILKALGVQPRRTIRIALWSGEEQGLWGSRAYVARHFGIPGSSEGVTPAYETFSAYYNQDYGPGRYQGIWLQENEHVRDIFAAWMEPLHDLGMSTIAIRSVGSTDHVPFDDAGLPGFQFLQDRAAGTGGHTNMDFYDTIPLDDLMINATIMAVFVYHTAMMDERMPRKGG